MLYELMTSCYVFMRTCATLFLFRRDNDHPLHLFSATVNARLLSYGKVQLVKNLNHKDRNHFMQVCRAWLHIAPALL